MFGFRDNQCFVIAAAQSGIHNQKRNSYGHSLVVDPWGTIVKIVLSVNSVLKAA